MTDLQHSRDHAAAEQPTHRFRAPTYDEAYDLAVDELGEDIRVVEANRIRRGGLGGFFATDLGIEVVVTADAARRGPTPAVADEIAQLTGDGIDRLLARIHADGGDRFEPSGAARVAPAPAASAISSATSPTDSEAAPPRVATPSVATPSVATPRVASPSVDDAPTDEAATAAPRPHPFAERLAFETAATLPSRPGRSRTVQAHRPGGLLPGTEPAPADPPPPMTTRPRRRITGPDDDAVRVGLDRAVLDTAHLDTAHLDTAHLDTAHLDTPHSADGRGEDRIGDAPDDGARDDRVDRLDEMLRSVGIDTGALDHDADTLHTDTHHTDTHQTDTLEPYDRGTTGAPSAVVADAATVPPAETTTRTEPATVPPAETTTRTEPATAAPPTTTTRTEPAGIGGNVSADAAIGIEPSTPAAPPTVVAARSSADELVAALTRTLTHQGRPSSASRMTVAVTAADGSRVELSAEWSADRG